MSTCTNRKPLAWLLVGALLASACGKDGAAPGAGGTGSLDKGAAGAGEAKAVFLPDTAPWATAPGPEAWELASWMPLGAQAEGRRVEPAFLREHGATLHAQSWWFETVDAWRRWARDLNLPEDGYSDVILVTKPIQFSAYLPRLKEAEIVSRLLAHGFREQPLDGARAFVAPGGEAPLAALIDGRLVLGTGEAGVLERVIALRAGREPSVRTLAGLDAAAAAVGAGQPVEIEVAQAGLKNGPPGGPPVIASVGRLGPGPDPGEVRALALLSEAEVVKMRATLEAMLAGVPLGESERPRSASRGAVLRLTSPAGLGRVGRSYDGGIHNDLRALARALERFRNERGALPSGAAGLSALADLPGGLDEFLGVLPRDPWGRPYAYQPEHPKRPDGFVLRSLGPDGEIDTEDDVLPPEE